MFVLSVVYCYVLVLQYGSEEFGQDSPRYTSPKATAALYASDPYYLGEFSHNQQFFDKYFYCGR